jgi:thiol-disulfide isomerase/thioredoxin
MTEGVWVLVVAVAAASAFGAYRAFRDGRFVGSRTPAAAPARRETSADRSGLQRSGSDGSGSDGSGLQRAELARFGQPGERATLLQFSSAFCAPCRATRRVLADVAGTVPGVTHVEVDAEQHLDLVRRVGVSRTPTTLILDADGRELTRAAGAPTKQAVLSGLAAVIGR